MGHSDAYYGPKTQLANRKNSLQWARGSVRRASGLVQILVTLKTPQQAL
jgi:hypothetical protein